MEDSIKFWICLALIVIIESGITYANPDQESFAALLQSSQSNDEPSIQTESFNFHPYLLYFPSMYAHVKSEDYIEDPSSSEGEADGETSDGEFLQISKIDVIQIPPHVPSLENLKDEATNIGRGHSDPNSDDEDDSSDSDSDSNSKESSEESSAVKKNHYGCGCLKNNIDGADSDDDDEDDNDSDEDGSEAIWDYKKKIKMHHLNVVQLGAQFLQDINSGLNLFQIADHALDTLIDDRKHNRSFGAQNLLFFSAALGLTRDLEINPEDYEDETPPMAFHQTTMTTTKTKVAAVPIKIVDNVQVNTINDGKSEKEIQNFVSVMKVSSPPNKGLEITSFVVGASVTSAFCICMVLLWKLSKGQLNFDKRTLIEVK